MAISLRKIEIADEWQILTHFLPYLINADSSGLDDREFKLIVELDRGKAAEYPGSHWHIVDGSEDFTRCDLLDCYAQTVTVQAVRITG